MGPGWVEGGAGLGLMGFPWPKRLIQGPLPWRKEGKRIELVVRHGELAQQASGECGQAMCSCSPPTEVTSVVISKGGDRLEG